MRKRKSPRHADTQNAHEPLAKRKRVWQGDGMRPLPVLLAAAALMCLSACNTLPSGQGDGGITSSESDQLNEAAEILDSQQIAPPVAANTAEAPPPPAAPPKVPVKK